MLRTSVVLSIVALVGCATAARDTVAPAGRPADATGIDSIAVAFLSEGTAAGFSIGVLRENSVVFAEGYGTADLENAVPAGPETVYRIGSLTKTMTAVAILQLAERGLLRLDDTVGRFLPDYPAPGRNVTIHQLLSMTSGIPNYTMDPRLDYFREQLAHDSVVALFSGRPLQFTPGERYDYSNSNFYLLGLIIETLSGQSYAEYVQQNVVAPLGFEDTRYCPNRPIIPRRAEGYLLSEGELANARPISVAWAYAAGGYCSTASDYMRWFGALGAGALIERAWFDRMASKTRLSSGIESGYGYGVAVDELGGHRQLSHSGNLDGFQASVSYFPDESLTVVVLVNTEDAGASDLKERIARHLLGVRRLTLDDVADRPINTADRLRYAGAYELETMPVRITVTDTGGTLHVSVAGQSPMRMLYQGDHQFVLAEDPETSLQFTLEDGLATRVVVRTAAGNIMPAQRVEQLR